jgi:hypothetical protein
LTFSKNKSKIFKGNMSDNIHTPEVPAPALRRASNSFKHGLYAKKLTYSTPAEHHLYSDILHNYVQHYRPITPDEETLVQQLAALQFRHLKVQAFQADAMHAEVLRQCQNAPAEADGSIPTETAIETRAFEALYEKPAFRLYIQELNRLPNKIQRTIDRIHLLIRLRPQVAAWSANQPASEEISKSEQTAQPEETKIETQEELIDFWNNHLDDAQRSLLIHGPYNSPTRQEIFRIIQMPEQLFSDRLKAAWHAGQVKLPPKPKEELPNAA